MSISMGLAMPILAIVGILTVILMILLTYYMAIYPLISKGKIFIKRKPTRNIRILMYLFGVDFGEFEKAYVSSDWKHLIFLQKGVILSEGNTSRYNFFLPYKSIQSYSFSEKGSGERKLLDLEFKADLLAEGVKVRDSFSISRAALEKRILNKEINYSAKDKTLWPMERIAPKYRDEIEGSLESHNLSKASADRNTGQPG